MAYFIFIAAFAVGLAIPQIFTNFYKDKDNDKSGPKFSTLGFLGWIGAYFFYVYVIRPLTPSNYDHLEDEAAEMVFMIKDGEIEEVHERLQWIANGDHYYIPDPDLEHYERDPY